MVHPYFWVANIFTYRNLRRNLIRPEFTVEQRGVTATIYREIFMSVRGDAKPNQTEQDTQKTTQKTTQNSLDSHDDTMKVSENGSEKLFRENR